MRKNLIYCVLITLLLIGCIETETTTTIEKDGSGQLEAVVDMGQMIQMLKSMKQSEAAEEEVKVDSTIRFSSFTDTSTSLTTRQKELLRNITLGLKINSDDNIFRFKILAPFKNTEELQEINQIMSSKEFDQVFDKAMSNTELGKSEGDQPESKRENDNIFGSIFPDYFTCNYSKGLISCVLNKEKYDAAMAEMKKTLDLEDEMAQSMFGSSSFVNRIKLPNKAKEIKGSSLTASSDGLVLEQKGSLLDIYQHPEKYVYTVRY
ncbi:MAG: hypothetical protein GXC78_12145 [Chitinophagaceae bacterium]|nr:hypothetical protein [Chitinophagaceae bacterium]